MITDIIRPGYYGKSGNTINFDGSSNTVTSGTFSGLYAKKEFFWSVPVVVRPEYAELPNGELISVNSGAPTILPQGDRFPPFQGFLSKASEIDLTDMLNLLEDVTGLPDGYLHGYSYRTTTPYSVYRCQAELIRLELTPDHDEEEQAAANVVLHFYQSTAWEFFATVT